MNRGVAVWWRWLLVALALLVAWPASADPPVLHAGTLRLWHGYRNREETALRAVIASLEARTPGLHVELLPVPYGAYASKLENSIPFGSGPDLFIGPHDWLRNLQARALVVPVDRAFGDPARYEPSAAAAVLADGHPWAVPLALKCLALFVNPARVPAPIARFEDLDTLRATLGPDVTPLAYAAQDAYFHAALAHAFGAGLVDDATGAYLFDGEGAARSVRFVQGLIARGVVPDEIDGAQVTALFVAGRAATVISGPWFVADLPDGVRYEVRPLPAIDAAGGRRPEPFVTVEGAYVSARSHSQEQALALAAALADTDAALVRARQGRQVVATAQAWAQPDLATDPFLSRFREAARAGRPLPRHPYTPSAFEPAAAALRRALRGSVSVETALREGHRRFDDATRPLPARRSPTPWLLGLGLGAFLLCAFWLRRALSPDGRQALRRSLPAYAWVSHAALAVGLLVIAPLVAGAAMSLFAGRNGTLYFVGADNFWDILRARGGELLGARSFYLVLLVTVAWTVANLSLHVLIGVSLALLLSRQDLRFRGLYRVLLIIPWAVPSYVTALAWRGMFHRQFGAVNAILSHLGVEPIAWFSRFATAFTANVATNVWLGFPFTMVVAIGALTAIPTDLYEAAAVDGATAWQRFRTITAPLLAPALAPSIAMGAVWTFNMFNVIYLVSGGEPDGETEILVTEAYRWAFTRQAQYGYAAAYAVLIFGILVVGTRLLDRGVQRLKEGTS